MYLINNSMTLSTDEVLPTPRPPLSTKDTLFIHLTFHHVLLVITVIITIRGPIVDIEAMDWSVVVTGWDILHGMDKRHVDSESEASSKPNHKAVQSPPQGLNFMGAPSKYS